LSYLLADKQQNASRQQLNHLQGAFLSLSWSGRWNHSSHSQISYKIFLQQLVLFNASSANRFQVQPPVSKRIQQHTLPHFITLSGGRRKFKPHLSWTVQLQMTLFCDALSKSCVNRVQTASTPSLTMSDTARTWTGHWSNPQMYTAESSNVMIKFFGGLSLKIRTCSEFHEKLILGISGQCSGLDTFVTYTNITDSLRQQQTEKFYATWHGVNDSPHVLPAGHQGNKWFWEHTTCIFILDVNSTCTMMTMINKKFLKQ